ncbi:MAG: glycoside hydrolase family protein [Myxococcota bacterium]|nr:glycoside hydrolase family protein [Myxococcota bacterium]
MPGSSSLERAIRARELPVFAILASLAGCGTSDNAPAPVTDAAPAPLGVDARANDKASDGGGEALSFGADDASVEASALEDGAGPAPGDAASPMTEASLGLEASAATDGGLRPFKGVANAACGDLTALGVSWYYNWTLNRGSCSASRFVPMIWGHTGSEQTAPGIANEIKGIVAAGYDTVLGFNEPDNATQSKITVAAAISLWPAFSASSLRVGSPATQANTAGMAWFTSFMSQVNADTTSALRVDFIAAHWYGWNAGSCDANAVSLEAYIKQLEAIPGNRPIWLTEWGCLNLSNPTAATVQAFYSGAIAMFARHPRIERYAWYPWTANNELVAGGKLTNLGSVFAAAQTTR